MITAFHAKNFKALRDISLQLTPIHVLIGPNDSGKTSILHAMVALTRSVDRRLDQAFSGRWAGRELVWHNDALGTVDLGAEISWPGCEKFTYWLSCEFAPEGREVLVFNEKLNTSDTSASQQFGQTRSLINAVATRKRREGEEVTTVCNAVHNALSGVEYFRWNPRMLALPAAPDSKRFFRMNSDGFGLALVLDHILGFDRRRFEELEAKFKEIFPHIGSIKLIPQLAFRAESDDFEQVSKLVQAEGKGLAFELPSVSELVPAAQISDGAMLVLACLAVLHSPKPPRLLLIEEPENGIHPGHRRGRLSRPRFGDDQCSRRIAADRWHTESVGRSSANL